MNEEQLRDEIKRLQELVQSLYERIKELTGEEQSTH
jgi:hypothetical protein|tara:strand:+ start:1136 stop:1243 length:108 start_codon:yes stop_codon:yes gene_type:complete